MTAPLSFTILGVMESKANSRNIVETAGKLRVIKSAKARAFATACKLQCPKRADLPFTEPVSVTVEAYYPDQRRDLDESALLDALQAYSTIDKKTKMRVVHWPGVWANDRLIRQKHVYHFIDAANPRVIVTVTELK